MNLLRLGFMPSRRSASISVRFNKIFPTALEETLNFRETSFLGVCKQTSLFENHKNGTGRLLNLPDHHRGERFLPVVVELVLRVSFSAFPTWLAINTTFKESSLEMFQRLRKWYIIGQV